MNNIRIIKYSKLQWYNYFSFLKYSVEVQERFHQIFHACDDQRCYKRIPNIVIVSYIYYKFVILDFSFANI